MNVFTHIVISKWLYRYFRNETHLNKHAFIYGNIKPDLFTNCFLTAHTIENYLELVGNMADDLINNELSLEESSIKLGEICHYTCDFFCLYHTNLIKSQNIINHFIYEMKLHHELLKNISRLNIEPILIKSEKTITSIILELTKEYSLKPAEMKKDIIYGLSASIRVCKSVFSISKNTRNSTLDKDIYNYSARPLEGGQ